MLIGLIRGKDLYLAVQNKEGEVTKFRFRSPHDGMFLTHEEIHQLKYKAEMDTFCSILEKQIYKINEE